MLFLGDKLFIIIIIIIIIMVEYTLEQRIFLYDAYVKYPYARRCRRKFQRQFAGLLLTRAQPSFPKTDTTGLTRQR